MPRNRPAPATAPNPGPVSSSELQPFEGTRGAPGVDVLEIRDRTVGMSAHVEPFAPADRAALVVVVAGRAVRVADECTRAALEPRDPVALGVGGDLDLVGADVERAGDDTGDGAARLGEVERDVRDEVRALRRSDDEE